MRVILRTAAFAAAEWKTKYGLRDGSWPHEEHPYQGRAKKLIYDELVALKADASLDEINAVIGNKTWTSRECEECGSDQDVLIEIGRDDYPEQVPVRVCTDCLRLALKKLDDLGLK